MDEATVREGLTRFVTERAGATHVAIDNLSRFSGGASRETWAFDAAITRGANTETIEAIFRADPIAGQPSSPGRERLRPWRSM